MFTFNKIVDDRTRGPQNNEIGVKIITANFDIVGETSQVELKHLSARENNILINISKYDNYLEEIENALKIDAYFKIERWYKIYYCNRRYKVKKVEKEERIKRAKFLIERKH